MALFYEMELKIQTRMCNRGGVGLLIKAAESAAIHLTAPARRNTPVPAQPAGLSRIEPAGPRSVTADRVFVRGGRKSPTPGMRTAGDMHCAG